MFKKIAAALIAASVLSAPLLIGGASPASAATTRVATPAKHGVKAVKKHRHVVVRHGQRYVKVIRHGKTVYLKVKPRRHYAVHGKKPVRHGTKIVRPRAA